MFVCNEGYIKGDTITGRSYCGGTTRADDLILVLQGDLGKLVRTTEAERIAFRRPHPDEFAIETIRRLFHYGVRHAPADHG
jgi:hypothetical protein